MMHSKALLQLELFQRKCECVTDTHSAVADSSVTQAAPFRTTALTVGLGSMFRKSF